MFVGVGVCGCVFCLLLETELKFVYDFCAELKCSNYVCARVCVYQLNVGVDVGPIVWFPLAAAAVDRVDIRSAMCATQLEPTPAQEVRHTQTH